MKQMEIYKQHIQDAREFSGFRRYGRQQTLFNREKREVCTEGRELPKQQGKQQVFAGSKQESWKTAISQLLELSGPLSGSKRDTGAALPPASTGARADRGPKAGRCPRSYRQGALEEERTRCRRRTRDEGNDRAKAKPGSAAGAAKSPFPAPLPQHPRRAHRQQPLRPSETSRSLNTSPGTDATVFFPPADGELSAERRRRPPQGPSSVKLENREDLCFISRQAESKKENQKLQIKLTKDQKWTRKEGPARNPKTERELLGELYADKAYLEKLLKDKDLMASSTKQGTKVADLVLSGISYLDTRGEFWQQQKPIYARVREHKLRQQRWIRDKKQKPAEVARYIVKSMEDIDMLLTGDCPEESCKKAERVLKTIQGWSDDEVPNKNQLIGNLHSCIGNAQLEMGQMEAALQSHKMDLEFARQNLKSSGTPKKIYKAEGSLDCIGNKTMSATMSSFSFQCSDLPDAVSRALDNIGRVYARMGKFQQAIDTWEEKIPMAKSSLEETWLFHEIGRCYLELNKAEQAQNYGEKSLQSAGEEGDVEWQLHATVLVAQAQVKLKDYRSAIMSFEKALEKAKLIHNEAAQKTIIIALDDASRSFIEELDKRREETTVYSLKDDGFGGENAKDNEEKEREQDAGKREAEKQSGGAGRFGGEPGSGRGGGQQGGSEGVAGGRGRRARRQQ
ncbi:outer dynein arm-docking complex subunit 4 isoform X4 [Phalacrocorax aristotelis]|uniref:outer dynein arm-docking complex subunit 4 isoform X4 n=1 Tax=Phalacrocorax aristotelis TaxID=126867 RepID=UPI003F4B4F9F